MPRLTPRLALESLEAREVPAACYWLGDLPGGWSTAGNWTLDPVTKTRATSAPFGFMDDVYFDGTVSNLGVSGAGGFSGYKSLHFVNDYSGTVAVGSLSVQTLELTSGTLNPLSASDNLMVSLSFTWTGGTLNSTSNLATLTISGSTATALFAPTNGGTVNLGSNINLSSGAVATMREGTINVTNDGVAINVNENCGMLVDPGAGHEEHIQASFDIVHGVQLNIKNQAWVKVASGKFLNTTPLKNEGGSFILRPDTRASFGGRVDNANNGPSVWQAAGVTYLYLGSILSADNGMLMSGGALSIQLDQGTDVAEFAGTLNITGGSIISGANNTGNNHLFGAFKVEGTVNWSGGTYQPYVSAESNNLSDVWYATGQFNISGSAALAPIAVDGENNVVTPPSGGTWQLFQANAGIEGSTLSLDPNLWGITPVSETRWNLTSK